MAAPRTKAETADTGDVGELAPPADQVATMAVVLESARQAGYDAGYQAGFAAGREEGLRDGYDEGVRDGRAAAVAEVPEPSDFDAARGFVRAHLAVPERELRADLHERWPDLARADVDLLVAQARRHQAAANAADDAVRQMVRPNVRANARPPVDLSARAETEYTTVA